MELLPVALLPVYALVWYINITNKASGEKITYKIQLMDQRLPSDKQADGQVTIMKISLSPHIEAN